MSEVSPRRRREVLDALRRGTVPASGLDLLAVGLERFVPTLDAELDVVTAGGSSFKAIRGEYGAGKTFVTRFLAERAARRGMATAEVQISETETPLHKLETVYRRIGESLRTSAFPPSALRPVLDSWLYTLEADVAAADPSLAVAGAQSMDAAVAQLLEQRLAAVSTRTPAFAQALRAYRSAVVAGDSVAADALAGWLGGQPHVAGAAKRAAGIRGELDHFGAMGFLQGLLTVLRDAGHPGLLLILDEVETLQRVRGDVRDKALNALRQLVDEVDSGRFPGLFLVITGTPAFYDGPSGVPRLPPLAQRLATDFATDTRFDNPRAVQLRLPGFDLAALGQLGTRVRDLFADGASDAARISRVVDDRYVSELAVAVTGSLGGRVGVAPRVFLKKLVSDVLDRVDQFDDFDPRRHYALTVNAAELTDVERESASLAVIPAARADDVHLDL
ncbi:BREX system ATP-binding protein BrxD [Modestobacter sp. VKM Ac-2985]|uniref:BREX system ATP-binding protein BrxD n=1 Tax=Modestobacter sp. VKM Ac-2985 TaxID=3004139 RepID=UPI0022AB6A5E|nr:BREX system ATP-binding protein BrxD [Modestobacter sp. VKM Ac-2985]MCZ2839921.1 BREX system ATP-binding protein BrxD [Modestobacter sp. VKM Ac-2985]